MQFYHTAQSFKSPGDHRLRVTAPAQDLHIQPLNLQVGLRPATQTAAAAVGLHIQKNFVSGAVSGKVICMLVVLVGVSIRLQFVVADSSGPMLTINSVCSFEQAFCSWVGPSFHYPGQRQTACMALCGWVVFWCQHLGCSGPWLWWGYGMGRRMLWTTNTGAFYRWHFNCTEILESDPGAHCCASHPQPSPHVAAWCCHFWRGVEQMFHRPRSATGPTLCEGDVLYCVTQMVVTRDTA